LIKGEPLTLFLSPKGRGKGEGEIKKGDLPCSFGGMFVCQRQNINQNEIKIEG